ncbi:MAG: hypothetical protein ACE5GT_08715 [Rhodospirillales bacterium]
MSKRFSRLVLSGLVAAGLGGCGGPMALDPDATRPPDVAVISTLTIPAWAGNRPTPYDGHWEGYLINESVVPTFCPIAISTYHRLKFNIDNGILRRVNYPAERVGADGYVNNQGAFIANTSGKFAVGQLFTGSISGDRMTGEWWTSGILCHGRIDLVRLTGEKRYCLSRLSGKPYATIFECSGIDRHLTRGEYRAMLGIAPTVN